MHFLANITTVVDSSNGAGDFRTPALDAPGIG
jgi:hypothetical protein